MMHISTLHHGSFAIYAIKLSAKAPHVATKRTSKLSTQQNSNSQTDLTVADFFAECKEGEEGVEGGLA
jgi:hypothetical protein